MNHIFDEADALQIARTRVKCCISRVQTARNKGERMGSNWSLRCPIRERQQVTRRARYTDEIMQRDLQRLHLVDKNGIATICRYTKKLVVLVCLDLAVQQAQVLRHVAMLQDCPELCVSGSTPRVSSLWWMGSPGLKLRRFCILLHKPVLELAVQIGSAGKLSNCAHTGGCWPDSSLLART